jgi:alpha-L-fucosidase
VVSDRNAKAFSSEDFRFTTKGGALYALGTPGTAGEGFTIKSLGTQRGLWSKPVTNVSLLGSDEKLTWTRSDTALVVERPRSLAFPYAVALKIS